MNAPDLRNAPSPEPLFLAGVSWGAYANRFSGMVDEARRVMKGGGLAAPGMADSLQLSRSSQGHAG